ncbi:MAG: hypothetical protein WA765_17175 [Candidatus Acidiferrum sp.]
MSDTSDRGQPVETCPLVVSAKSTLRKEVHGKQDAYEEREKRAREFPE